MIIIFRYLSLPTLEKAQTAVKYNFVISNCLMLMAGWLGMVMYSVYRDCDPISAKQVTMCTLTLTPCQCPGEDT